MGGVEAVLRLALEKSWTLGVLVLVACGLVWGLSVQGFTVPPQVREWAPTGTAGGVALIALSLVNALLAGVRSVVVEGFHAKRSAAASGKKALANIQTCTREEAEALLNYLSSPTTRFQLHSGSYAFGLVQKDIMVIIQQAGGMQWICEVHPAVLEVREKLKAELAAGLARLPPKRNDSGSTGWMAL